MRTSNGIGGAPPDRYKTGMNAQIFLIAPADADAAGFPARLSPVLDAADVSALLLPRGTQAENAYKSLVKAVLPHAQARNCAVLIEGEPGWVRLLGADGLHVSGPVADLRHALGVLKPDMIVGAAGIDSRHDAMAKGELEVDYIFFGPLSGSTDAAIIDMAQWWAETMEIPSVISLPQAEAPDAGDCEFLAVGERVWAAENPAAELARLAGEAR